MDKQATGFLLGQLEKQIMECVWQAQGAVTVRDVHAIIQKKRPIAYTTVMTIMGRLVQKGLLKRKAKGNAYIYQPVYAKDIFLTRLSRHIIKNFVANFGESAVAHFTEELEKVTPQKRQKLLRLLEGVTRK